MYWQFAIRSKKSAALEHSSRKTKASKTTVVHQRVWGIIPPSRSVNRISQQHMFKKDEAFNAHSSSNYCPKHSARYKSTEEPPRKTLSVCEIHVFSSERHKSKPVFPSLYVNEKTLRVNDGAAVGEGCPGAGQGTKASMFACVKRQKITAGSPTSWKRMCKRMIINKKDKRKENCHDVAEQAQLFPIATVNRTRWM